MDDVEEGKRKTFFRIRVAVLLSILVIVAGYAFFDVKRRRERLDWTRTLDVAFVVVTQGDVDASSVELFKRRATLLTSRLTDEMHRYKPGSPNPFLVTVFGPVASTDAAPKLEEDGLFALAKHSYSLWSYTSDLDGRADIPSRGYDARIYVTVRAPKDMKRAFVEGASEEGGRIGIVDVELGPGTVDFALIVAAHELFHTLGATDKYDAQGHTTIPDGLAEPELGAAHQRFVELMARNRPIEHGEVPPDTIDDFAVGPATAIEIGWK